MKLSFAVMFVSLVGTTSVFSAVTISVPEEIKIEVVNGQEVGSSLFRKNQNIKLDAGINKISVRYTDYFQHHDNSHDILKSGLVTITTPELKDGENYSLKLMNAPKDFEEAQEYKNRPVIGLYNATSQLLVQQEGALQVEKSLFGNNFLGKTLNLTSDKSQTPVNQPAPTYTSTALESNIPKSQKQNVVLATEKTGQDLIQLWQQTSKQERQKFMSWLAEQAN